ncbi:MAG: hypothetical protein IJ009_07275 [Clostridia bacterium]|nr:hypothetical protein [Clostridia bacterium]
MTDNYFEYAVDAKPSGKNLLFRILLIISYALFAALFFVVFYAIHIPHLIALLPFSLVIFVMITWRYVSCTYEYIIAVGEISFARIYSNKLRKEILRLHIRDLRCVMPEEPNTNMGRYARVYDFRSAPTTPDSYCLVFVDGREKECLVYFEATNKALKLLSMYNPSAVSTHKKTRY